TACGLLVALAYPDRIARRRQGEPGRYRLSSGRGVRLEESDPLAGQDWLAVAQLDAGRPGEEGRIFLAAPIDPAQLEIHLGGLVQEEEQVAWEPRQQAVVACRQRLLGAHILEQKSLSDPDPQRLAAAMAEGIRRLGLEALPWSEPLRQWQARLLSLSQWLPEEDWPDVSDTALLAQLEDWLGPFLNGITRREHLARLDLATALQTRLDWPRRNRLEILAPTHLTVPSGSRLRLEYRPGQAPVLAVKLQEMFGLGETPRIVQGRVAVVLQLLSPARRPIQVTQDLRGFWERTYPEVKKELKGRYPKHPWPEDPWNAPPTARTRRQQG
ncbi:MAG: ATP-dependent helicase C-terminal domain-containing protein, partial [Candidatus Competibacteraceae bacterium]|nr:ATP-dependent helicase C-terminal domain-containing protein [Candidatus Competibacteraceae bacterium]